MKKVTINLYSFDELNEAAKQKAIDDHRNFELSIMQESDFISGDSEHDTPEKLSEAYNTEYSYLEENDEPIIESIEANDYLFFSDGSLADCVTYTIDGRMELKMGNDVYVV
jgi:hypothetical protein